MNAETRLNRLLPLVCAAVSIAAVFATIPLLEMGVNDDFSYNYIALHLARSGRLVYNGWSMPILGFQAWWAAMWIRLFGFGFTLVRLTALPFFAGCAMLLYHLGRRAGLKPVRCAFFALFITLSPLTFPLASSFMTDVPALFFLLTCFVAALYAIDAADERRFAGWLFLIAGAGVLGGTIRQIVWICPAVLIPYALFRRRPRFATVVASAAIWAASILCAVQISRWYSNQPYAEVLTFIPRQWLGVVTVGSNSLGLALELLVLCLPVLISGAQPRWKRWSAERRFLTAGSALLVASCLVELPHLSHRLRSLPFGYFPGNLLTSHGVLAQGIEAIGDKPLTLPDGVQILVLAAAITALAGLLTTVHFRGWRNDGTRRFWASPVHGVCIVFLVPYLATVASRAFAGEGIDRYLLPALVTVGLMLFSSKTAEEKAAEEKTENRGLLPWLILLLWGVYGVATTHDYLARSRARLEAANLVIHEHVSRLEITAGVEYDGWTQISYSGHLNDPHISNPRGAYRATAPRTPDSYWFWDETPDIRPRWFVVLSRQPGLRDSQLTPVAYTTWLPPGRGQVFVQVK